MRWILEHASCQRRNIAALVAALCLFIAPAIGLAQTTAGSGEPSQGEVSRMTTQLSDEIYSPFCPGKTLSMCPSPNAAKVRRDIQRMAREGKSKDEIKKEVLAVYGEEFRIVEPPPQDNVMLLLAIVLGLVIAISAVVFLTRRRNTAGGSSDAPKKESTSADVDADVDENSDGAEEDLDDDERAYLDDLREELSD